MSDFNPMPKNPIIASFFTQIGYAAELGSGLRNLEKYSKALLGADPVLSEGDVFVAQIPRKKGLAEGDRATGPVIRDLRFLLSWKKEGRSRRVMWPLSCTLRRKLQRST